jgi:membrane protein insertase Oxa1/YidC/SpoIIIJ
MFSRPQLILIFFNLKKKQQKQKKMEKNKKQISKIKKKHKSKIKGRKRKKMKNKKEKKWIKIDLFICIFLYFAFSICFFCFYVALLFAWKKIKIK